MSDGGADFVKHCLDLLGGPGRARARRMFGGQGLYVDELFVALIAGGTLYLKVDAGSHPLFEQAGSQPFDYATREGSRVVLSYWSAPQDAMESPALMLPWVRLAMDSARRAAASKARATPRKARAVAASTTPAAAAGQAASRRSRRSSDH